MGYKYSKSDLLAAAMEVASQVGLSNVSFGKVAKHLGISDRTIVYYFPSKQDLLQAVIAGFGFQLGQELQAAFAVPAARAEELIQKAWPTLTTSAEPVFRLFFEAIGLAIYGRSPFAELVPKAMEGWVQFLMPALDLPEAQQRTEAETALALLDGLMILHFTVGAESAKRALQRLVSNQAQP